MYRSDNVAYAHADVRASGNNAIPHKYTYNTSTGTYQPYTEYWWDSDSYHSLGVSSNQFLIDGSVVWNAGNDGAGSGLDADTVDGNQASAFALVGQTMHIGTTAVAINRGSGALSLTGVSIDGNAGTVSNLTAVQFFNNMGQTHSTRTSFDATNPSYDFGFRYVQGSGNGPGIGAAGTQYYSLYIGLGNEYPSTGGSSYGAMLAINRVSTGGTNPYLSIRFNENNTFGAWSKIYAGYADSAGGLTGYSGTFWTSNNDGAGSGLDADLLDGNQASAFAILANANNNFTSTGNTFRNRIGIGDGNGTPFTNTGSPGVWLSYNGGSDLFMGAETSTRWGVYIGAWRMSVDNGGNVVAGGNITAYGTPSDERYKYNIKPIQNALNTVLQLEGVTFNWKHDTPSYEVTKLDSDVGFIAQQVKTVLPDIVREGEDGYLGLRERAIIPLLVEAIKELNKKIESLEGEKSK
jgi:hypothetical protein